MYRLNRLLAAAFVAAVFICPAIAAEDARTVDMTTVLLDENGKPAKDQFAKKSVQPGEKDMDPDCDKCPVLTLGLAASHALFASFPDDHDTPDQKWARAVLAQRIKSEQHAQLTVEEIAVIKRQLGKAYGGVLLMQAYPLLDPNGKPPEVK